MKNKILLVALCWMVVASCRKTVLEDGPVNTDDKVKVKFLVVQRSDATTSNSPSLSAPLADLITQLTYVVYVVGTDVEVARQTQFNTDPQFGQLSLALQKGEYNFVVIGSKASFGLNQFFWQDGTPPLILNFLEAFMEDRQQSEVDNMLNQWEGGFKIVIDDKWIDEPNIVEL